MLAKQDTPIKARRTVRGRVPAKLSTLVIKMRSILVLLSAEEMVKPPMSSMMVGENIIEKTYLNAVSQLIQPHRRWQAYFVASMVDMGDPSSERMTWNQMSSMGTAIDVANKGMAYGRDKLVSSPRPKNRIYDLCRPQYRAEHENGKTPIRLLSLDNLDVQEDDKYNHSQQLEQFSPCQLEPTRGCRHLDNLPFVATRVCRTNRLWASVHVPTPFLGNHLSPDSVSLPSNVFALMELELLLSLGFVPVGNALGV
jgi:hypothetical protein